MLKAVIFDVDGTLVDSNEWHIQAWQRAFRHFGKKVAHDAIQDQMGKGGDQLMPVFFTAEELERHGEEMQRLRVEMFMRDYLPRVRPFPRVRELFERIQADGLRIVLASSAKAPELERHIETLRIGPLIEAATSADDAEHSKPSPDIFQAALARLKGVKPDAAMVVGDTPYDVQAASKAGMKTIGLLSGRFSEDRLRANGVAAVYRDVADLLAHYDDSPLSRQSSGKPT
jgi:HAD superfamily hydrolase (TIGR01509 family)